MAPRQLTPTIIIDASSLIVLARLRALPALHQTYGEGGLTPSVYEEVVTRGKAKGFPDATRVEAAVERRTLQVVTLTSGEKRWASTLATQERGLSQADCETLACAKERGLPLLMEERRGRNVARARNIAYVTIQVFPLYGLIRACLSVKQCDGLLSRIGRAMNTDLAVVEALRIAAREIGRTRGKA